MTSHPDLIHHKGGDAPDTAGRHAAPTPQQAAALLRESGVVVELPVHGNSMLPLLKDGDTARVRAGAEVRVGDVVVALSAAGLIVHRVVFTDGNQVRLCGDSAHRCDEMLDQLSVLGRVVAVDGVRHRRLDMGLVVAMGRMTAAYSRLRDSLGGRPRRPRPGRLAAAYLRLAESVVPASSVDDAVALRLASPNGHVAVATFLDQQPSASIDWARLAERALLGQIGPQVYASARRLPPRHAPTHDQLEGLRLQAFSNVARTHRLLEILDALLARLDEVGVLALAHKGIALAACVYRDPAQRIMGDIDLSVRDDERSKAENAARAVRSALSRANPDRRSGSGFHVELDGTAHHDVDPALFGGGRWKAESLDWEGMWSRSLLKRVGGHNVLVPCPTDLLLTLTANSIRRGFTPVRLVVDVAHTIHCYQDDIDWSALEAELKRTHLDRRSWIALQMAVSWCGANVPLHLLEPPADLRTASYERLLLEWKRERPFARLPSRVLWAGSWIGAIGSGLALVGARMSHALRLPAVARAVSKFADELRQEYRRRSA